LSFRKSKVFAKRPYLICDKRHNSRSVIFQEKLLKVLKCYNLLWVQRRHNCSPAASFANCVMTLYYMLKLHLQTFLSISVTQNAKFWVVTLLSQMSDMNHASTKLESSSEKKWCHNDITQCSNYGYLLQRNSPKYFLYTWVG
jgi:hypothetical protein